MILNATKEKDHKVLVEQIRLLHRSQLPILAVNVVVSTALLYGLWDVVSQSTLTTWIALMFFVITLRVFSWILYRRTFQPAHAQKYGLYFVIGTGLTGLLWGVGGVVLFPDQGLEYQLFILFTLVGLGAGSVSSLTTYLPAFFVFFPTSMLPIGVQLFIVGDPIHFALGLMTFAYVIALTYFGININRTLKESLKLRFENIDLVEQLRKQKEEAELANIAKSKFLAAASHDLRQPLHALTLFTSVLDESIQYPKVRKVVDQINASVQALQSLFNALLDVSRLDAGVMTVEKNDFLIQPLLQKLANDFNPQAKEKGLTILWEQNDFIVHSDEALLERILRNYLSNAIRYTNHGEIRVNCEDQGNLLNIHVVDTGVGIPAQEQQAIFEEFHQLSNPERDRSKGLGLGLAIVQRTAKLLEHPISLSSQPGKGSCFTITVEKKENTDRLVLSKNSIVNNNPNNPEDCLIIVIDDEVSILEGTQKLLELWGCEVIIAENEKEAMEKIRRHTRLPDGMIVDYRLKEKRTGVEVIQAIHTETQTAIPATIVTGDIAAEQLREVNDSGFLILHKPIAPVKLRAFLHHVQRQKNLKSNA